MFLWGRIGMKAFVEKVSNGAGFSVRELACLRNWM